MNGAVYAGGDENIGCDTGGAANAEFGGGGVANVVAAGAARGCVAVGKRTCCARALSAIITSVAAAVILTSEFKRRAVAGRKKSPFFPSAQHERGNG